MAKLTKAQRERLAMIAKVCARDRDGFCSKYDAGYPNWPMEARLKDAGLIEIIEDECYRWPMHSAKGYRITDAGRAALSPDTQEATPTGQGEA